MALSSQVMGRHHCNSSTLATLPLVECNRKRRDIYLKRNSRASSTSSLSTPAFNNRSPLVSNNLNLLAFKRSKRHSRPDFRSLPFSSRASRMASNLRRRKRSFHSRRD